ncbi:MAG: TIGR03087 family PEP-CTERM/XrtA system glycosyltransferase [Pirellula sp.]
MRPKVIFLTHRLPYPPNRGDRIRAYHTIKFLSKYADIKLGSVADEAWLPEHEAALRELCEEVSIHRLPPRGRWVRAMTSMAFGRSATEGAFFSQSLAEQVRRWTAGLVDGAVLYCSSMGQYSSFFGVRPKQVVVDLVDVDSQKWRDYVGTTRGARKLLYRMEAERVKALEARLSKEANWMTVVSEEEASLYRAIHPGSAVSAVSNGVDQEYFSPYALPESVYGPMRQGAPQMVFVGVLDYWPNEQGLDWFVRHVMPVILQRYPSAKLQIVGRRPSAKVQELAKFPGVHLVGEVDDVRPYVLSAHFAIAPLKIARGVQNKVLEALACGRPVVATHEAATGIEHAGGVLIADTPEQWLEAVEALQDQKMAENMAQAARRGCEQGYSWEAKLQSFLDMLGLRGMAEHGETPSRTPA